MIDLTQPLFEAFRDWIPTRLGTGVTVIRKRPNAPAPKGHYLVIDDGVGLEPVGQASLGYRTPTDWNSRVTDWSGVIALWEIGARSHLLATLLADLELHSAREFFSGKGISIFRPGPISPIPSLEDSDWVEQYRVEIPVGLASGQTDESLTYIETVDLGSVTIQDGTVSN